MDQQAPPAAGAPENWIEQGQQLLQGMAGRLIMIVLVIILAMIAYALLRRVLSQLRRRLVARAGAGDPLAARRVSRSLTVVSLLASIAKWTVLLLALLWILAIAGVDLMPVLAGAGVAGLAIGLGAQSLIKDFLSGLFIMLEGQFAVGDYVSIGAMTGVVEELGLRVTVLRDLQGQLHYLPNGSIIGVTVYEKPLVKWGLALQVPADLAPAAAEVVRGALRDLRVEFPAQLLAAEDPRPVGLDGPWTALQATMDVSAQQQWVVQEELPLRLNRALQQLDERLSGGVPLRVYQVLSGPLAGTSSA